MKIIIRFAFLSSFIFSACKSTTHSAFKNDLGTLIAPQGTKRIEQIMWIYTKSTDQLTIKNKTTFTFNQYGNYNAVTHDYLGGSVQVQTYKYDGKGRITQITDSSSTKGRIAVTTYRYSGENPLEITTSVEGGNNLFPKIVRYFENNELAKEQRYDFSGNLLDLYTFKANEKVHINYGLSNEIRFKYVTTLSNGYEIRNMRYNRAEEPIGGTEFELDEHHNLTKSWTLDSAGNRIKQKNAYRYLYKKNAWVIRVNAYDSNLGPTTTVYTRSISGPISTTVNEKEVLDFLKSSL